MNDRIIRFLELKNKIGVSRSTIYRWEIAGKFPMHIILGNNSVGWVLSQVEEWICKKYCKNEN